MVFDTFFTNFIHRNNTALSERTKATTLITTTSTMLYDNNNVTDYQNIFTNSEKLLITYSFLAVSLIGIISNSVVCYLILRYRHLRVIVNMLILNLAFSDIIACVSVYPFIFLDIHRLGTGSKSANILCGITEGLTLFFIAASVSLLTLSILSISRYLVINHPLKLGWRLERRSIKYIFILTWVISTALLIPSSVSFRYNEEKKFCDREWAPGVHTLTYFTCTGILGFLIPITSLSFTYITSLYTLWFKPTSSSLKNQIRPHGNNVKKRVLILLGMLIVVYFICWIPFAIYWLLSAGMSYFTGPNEIKGIRISRITLFIALFQTVLNPMVYAFSNAQLRGAARNSFRVNRHNSVAHTGSANSTQLTRFSRRHTITIPDWNDHELQERFRARDMTL